MPPFFRPSPTQDDSMHSSSSSSSSCASTPLRRKVHFYENVRVRRIPKMSLESAKEAKKVWYTPTEMQAIRSDVCDTIECIQDGLQDMERGLEYRLPHMARQRQSMRKQAVALILQAQQRAYYDNVPLQVPPAYIQQVTTSRANAYMMGVKDEQAVYGKKPVVDGDSSDDDDDESTSKPIESIPLPPIDPASPCHETNLKKTIEKSFQRRRVYMTRAA